jgi:hypothetical protein
MQALTVAQPQALAPAPVQEDTASLGRKARWFRAFETNKEREMKEQRTARQYYHDKQWTDDEVKKLEKRGQQATVRNRIKRKIDFLVGVEQRLRRDPKAYPRTPKHEKDADVATSGLRFACDMNRWEKISSDAMNDGLVTGIGVIFVGIEEQDPKLKGVQVDRYFYDPRSMMPDFSDARYMGLHLWFDEDEAAEKWPDKAEALKGLIDANNVGSTGIISEQDHATQWGDFEGRRVRVVEFWEKKRDGWHYCFFAGEVYLEGGVSPYLDDKGKPDCPYEAWSPYVDERGDRYGMIRTMKSVQDEINYSASKLLHRISSNRIYYNQGAVEDPDEFARQMARPDGKLEIHGKWGEDVGVVEQQVQIQGESERFQMAAAEIENLGPNPGLVGKGTGVDGASGRALLAQRDSGMTELSPVFERQRDWKLRVYRKLWARCRQIWTGEKWIRITDDDDSVQFIGLNQYTPQPDGTIALDNHVAGMDVDIILNEGPDTITMNEELMQTLSQIGEAAVGPLGKVLIELSNAPNKERLLKIMSEANAPSPEVAAMQQRMGRLEELLKAATIDEKIAGVENKRADTVAKLMTASTPPAQGAPDEFGNMPPPAPTPDMSVAMQAMSLFPLHYASPTLEQMAESVATQPPPMQAGPDGQPPQGGPPPQGQPPGQPPMPQPEDLTQAGALPINPMS